ncbi:hypothetical protein GCM10028775_56320 [Catellatospora paridis]
MRRFAAWNDSPPIGWQVTWALLLASAATGAVYRRHGWALGLAAALYYGAVTVIGMVSTPRLVAWREQMIAWAAVVAAPMVFFVLAILFPAIPLWQIAVIALVASAILAPLAPLVSRRRQRDAAQATPSLLPSSRPDPTMLPDGDCLLCRPADADKFFNRRRVWEDEHWRLSVVLRGAVAGFAHLETRRHIPYITDLAAPEAATLGPVLARATAAVREATGADKVYVNVFGDRVPHLHFNLAPCHPGGPLVGGAGQVRPDAPAASPAAHDAAAKAVRRLLTGLA